MARKRPYLATTDPDDITSRFGSHLTDKNSSAANCYTNQCGAFTAAITIIAIHQNHSTEEHSSFIEE